VAQNKTKAIEELLNDTRWVGQTIDWFPADWSTRRYGRIHNGDTSAILLDSPPDHSPESMIGHQIGAWYTLNQKLHGLGLNVPEIYAVDLNHGLILMEDFGSTPLPDNDENAYKQATKILITMRNIDHDRYDDLIRYEDTHVYKALRFFPEYVLGTAKLENDWFQIWRHIENSLPTCPRALTHIDFQAANLMWMPETLSKIGVIDFQATCDGPCVYDLVNLLEDVRRVVPDTIKENCIAMYKENLSPNEQTAFDQWYPVITAQFHARVAGQILKLAKTSGREDLMKFYEQLIKRLEKDLSYDALLPLKEFIMANGGFKHE
jgi:aminoglycoside/choline kinase family phosphotransferase